MITRENFKDAMKALSPGDQKKITSALYDYEYAEIRTTSYGHIWLESLTNDLPHDYDEKVSDGTTSFISVEEIIPVL